MNMTDQRPGVSPVRRVTIFYFFSAMSVGAANGFAGIWFASKGMSAEQVGWINAAPVVVMLVIGLIVGRVADRANDWRRVIIFGALASGIIPLGLFVADGFWGLMVVWTLAVTTQMAILPVMDAASMRLSRRQGFDFSLLYGWNTIGYLSVIFVSGYILVWRGVEAFLPLFVGLALVRGLTSMGLPKFRAEPPVPIVRPKTGHLRQMTQVWFVLPLLGWAFVHSTHFVLNGFQGLLWLQQGISAEMIGLLIGVSGVAEAMMFFVFRRFTGTISARYLILASCLIAAIRWGAMSLSPGVEVLFGLQLLHAITYALGFLACTNFIANWTSEDVAAEAQSLFTVLQFSIAIVALIAFGWLASAYGARAYLMPAVLAVLGGLLVWLSMWLKASES